MEGKQATLHITSLFRLCPRLGYVDVLDSPGLRVETLSLILGVLSSMENQLDSERLFVFLVCGCDVDQQHYGSALLKLHLLHMHLAWSLYDFGYTVAHFYFHPLLLSCLHPNMQLGVAELMLMALKQETDQTCPWAIPAPLEINMEKQHSSGFDACPTCKTSAEIHIQLIPASLLAQHPLPTLFPQYTV